MAMESRVDGIDPTAVKGSGPLIVFAGCVDDLTRFDSSRPHRSGIIIGYHDEDRKGDNISIIATNAISCLDPIHNIDNVFPDPIGVIARYFHESTQADVDHGPGLICIIGSDGVITFSRDNAPIEYIVKQGDPFADHLILYSNICWPTASIDVYSSCSWCRVMDQIISCDQSTPCNTLLSKESSTSLNNSINSFSHPFAPSFASRVITVDFLINFADCVDDGYAPELTRCIPGSSPLVNIDALIIIRRHVPFSIAVDQLRHQISNSLSNRSGSGISRQFYSVKNLPVPIAISSGHRPPSFIPSASRFNPSMSLVLNPVHINGQRLYNVHRALIPGPESDPDIRVHLVCGPYAYYHYMQDGINDDGWGCAYRSLQTLWSWANRQGLTHDPVPSIPIIQQIIYDQDQKEKSFVGSRQWIGAIEVSHVLSSLGITCRILPLSSGAEFGSKGRELAQHFDSHGSPIMIGGGVLAYTLLGVQIHRHTGQVRYLILDPHYKGGDNIGDIISKGWCSWRSGDLFDQGAFYNLCMPLNPTI
uniref:UFSP1/2/DUB catalytic domain-containing protein n=1 Tax=Spongospora subterranea TaxID=70186 RepID=A0A0H5RNF3_9EUKA|eukprot:CRZ10269.1 hypothetical protein [Spongospora subterranea]